MRGILQDDIDRAAGTGQGDWIDLSTTINRRSWCADNPAPQAFATNAAERLTKVAADWFGCDPAQVLPVADALAAILRLPPRRAAVLAPGDTGPAASFRAAGWQVARVSALGDMAGAALALVVNPNNPDGRAFRPDALRRLAWQVGHLVVDERLADPRPDLSLAPDLPANTTLLRSLHPFWGLPGLDFVLADPALLARLSGSPRADNPAMALGAQAMADRAWADAAVVYLSEAALRLDRLAVRAGWRMAGGTHLFRLYDTGDAAAAQDRLARAHIRAHRFPWSDRLLRLGIPTRQAEWDRLSGALREI
jgi:cobalamin biosynthetic protein CobC